MGLALTAGWMRAAAPPSDVHLFFDPAETTAWSHLVRTVNPPSRREIVLRADRPWESLMISFYLTVRDEGGKLRLWYICRDRQNRPNLAYAESADGINWVKPDLGIVDYDGSRQNNLVGIASVEGVVFADPNAAPAERYDYITHEFPQGMYRYVSPDGLHWRRRDTPILRCNSDTQNVVFWDERQRQYRFYLRGWNPGTTATRTRKVVTATAASLDQPLRSGPTSPTDVWGKTSLPWIVNQFPTVLACDDQDPPHTDIYNLSALPYPRSPDWYVGFPSYFRHHPDTTYEGRVETHFVASRGGDHWETYDRAAYTAPGPADSESANMVFLGEGLVLRGDEIWQYGTGFRSGHGDVAARLRRTDGVIYRYVQRLDGFVSVDAGKAPGRLTTAPLARTGGGLVLNADTGALGEIRVEVCDAQGAALPGYGLDDCDPVAGNGTELPVSWHGRRDLSAAGNQTVELRMQLRRAKLYSYRFSPQVP